MNLKNINNKIYSDEMENQELISLFNSGDLESAKKKALQLLSDYPKAYVIYNIYGAILATENKLNQSIIQYKKSIEIKFDYAEAHNNLGTALQKLNNLPLLVRAAKKVKNYC